MNVVALTAQAKPTRFDRRKAAIVEAAIPLLNREGVRGMTLPLVAAQLDLVPRAVSYYFRRKEELAAACLHQSIVRLEGVFTRAGEADDACAALEGLIEEFFEFRRAVAVGEEAEIAWFEEMRTLQDPAVGEAFVNLFRLVRRAVFRAKGSPALDRLEQNARTHQLMSQLFWAVLWLPRYHVEDYPRMGKRLADILIRGLAAEGKGFAPRPLDLESQGREPGAVSRKAFLRAATLLINEHGYLGASVSKISAHLNVSKGAFYYHNDAKNDLVEQCFQETWARIRTVQNAALESGADGLTSLASQSARLVSGQLSGEARLLRTSALAAVPEDMRQKIMADLNRATLHFGSVVCDGVADGSIRPLDTPLAAQMIAGGINAAAELHHWAKDITPEQAVRFYVRPLFTGMLNP